MSLFNLLFQDINSILTSLGIGLLSLLIYYVLSFYTRVRRYPKGPFPFPLVGNFMMFRGRRHIHETIVDQAKTYGPIFTIWFGTTPNVMICDTKHVIEAFRDKKNDFAGRPQFRNMDLFFGESMTPDVALADWGREWEVMRRVAHTAARKFAVSPVLPGMIAPIVDETLMDIKKKSHEFKDPFKMDDYVHYMLISILASIAFGQKYQMDDPEFLMIKNGQDEQNSYNIIFLITEFLPFLKIFYRKQLKRILELGNMNRSIFQRKLQEHMVKFKEVKYDEIRDVKNEMASSDFTDAVILAKLETEAEHPENSEFLKEINMINILLDLFFAGTETTRVTLRWIFLFLADNPEMQEKMRQEIQENIPSDQHPNLDHRHLTNYTCAFISEVMRYRPIIPLAVPHRAIVDSSIGDAKIPEGTAISGVIYATLHEKEVWGDPKVFRPERFLDPDTGKHSTRIDGTGPSFMPFSTGRRSCLGEKLALSNLYMVLTRFLQKTKGYQLVLKDGKGSVDLNGDLDKTSSWMPVDFYVKLVPSDAGVPK